MTDHTDHPFDLFTQAYIEAALWAETAHGSPDEEEDDPDHHGTFDRSFQDCNYDASDLSPELLAHVIADCAAFQKDHAGLLERAYQLSGYDAEQAGHDFWLTRNGHGAGFWDRGLGRVGDQLSDAAHHYGTEDWYVDTSDLATEYGVIRS